MPLRDSLKYATRLFMICVTLTLIRGAAHAIDWPGESSSWNGYDCHDFTLAGRACKVVSPHEAAEGLPWIWRARFWGHEPQTDLALLGRGFHLVYMDVSDLYGAPRAVQAWNAFYDFLTSQGLGEKCVMEGMSRGGLIVYNWASENADKVACIYADAPVCDVRSWPGGKGKGPGSPDDWMKCLDAYGLSEEEMMKYDKNPIDRLEPLAEAMVPALHVCGAADEVVPIDENTHVLEQRFRKLGGLIRVIEKPGVGHHPHSLIDPAQIVDFIITHALSPNRPEIELRGGLRYAKRKFETTGHGRVVFLGGSITHNAGWRDMTCDYLRRRFPNTEFSFTNAGIPSMGSTPGAFRLVRDVFSAGPVDLLFVEAAVNDEVNNRIHQEPLRGMEGIIRHARDIQPDLDIVMMHFADPGKTSDYQAGRVPRVIKQHEQVADYYQIPSLNLAKEVANRLNAGEFSWENDFKDLHPSPFGQRLYAKSIRTLLEQAWADKETPRTGAYPRPEKPIDPFSYFHGELVDINQAKIEKGWTFNENWKPADQAGTRADFTNVPMLTSETPGSSIEFSFNGAGVGIFVAAGPDAGAIEYAIDGGETHELDLFTQWSNQLHLPWAHVLEAELQPGPHTLRLRVSEHKNEKSVGHAVRIRYFLVNGVTNGE
ncbi:MAG: prolyl oligopeptidase family serine peptidase [bacterium]|nr:prolyl oligopeptidase family serine peptidase [bacterium]